MKFLRVLKNRNDCRHKSQRFDFDLARDEIYWIKILQESLLKEHKFSQWRQQFGDNEGLWRCKGRLSEADITEFAKYPILLDASHHITALIVKSCHEKVLHDEGYIDGIEIMVWGKAKGEKVAALLCNLIVDRFSLHHVLHCLDSESKNLNHLQYTGVDFAGPLYIVNDPDTKVVDMSLHMLCD